ncbi:hypothetical protein ACQ4PT_056375 [Festuca glaucescens]
MEKGPKRMSRPLRRKLPVVIPKGKTWPESAFIAAKFARECNNVVRNHVPVRSHWNHYKDDTGLLADYYGEVASKFDVDINVSAEYFYNMDRPIPEESPVASMSNDEWKALVDHWNNPQMMKICAKNKKTVQWSGFIKQLGRAAMQCIYKIWETLQDAIDEMEKQLSEPTTDGGQKSEAQVVSKVLSRNTNKPSFLRNAGLVCSSGSKISNLVADLEIEKRGSEELLDIVSSQRYWTKIVLSF